MNKYFSKFQTTIFLLIIFSFLLFFIFYSFSKFEDIFRSVYLQENQSAEKYNYYSMSLISSIEKSYNNIFLKNSQSKLPEIRLYVKENNFSQLLDDLPTSKNNWINSFLLNKKKNKLSKVDLKIKGDNPNNWLHKKKSYRLKFRKNNLNNLSRSLDYVIPRDSSLVNTYLGYYLASKMNIQSPKVRFVDLYINDDFQGLYLEVERTDESFLRKRNIMPVNIYNGAPSRTNDSLSLHNDLFINSSLWEKQSVFNRLNQNNFEDLDTFLEVLIKSTNSKSDFDNLKEIANINEWAKYSAYETIMQSWHSYENNNMRIISDNWKGEITPIAYDSIFNDANNRLIIEEEILYDNAPHLLTDTLLKSSEFNLKKYIIVKDLIDNGIFSDIKKEIDSIYNQIKSSWYADPSHYQFVITNNFRHGLYFNQSMDKQILKLKKRVDFIEKKLKEIIYETNIAKWFFENNNINFLVTSAVPVTSLNICYEKPLNKNSFYFAQFKISKLFKYNEFQNLHCYKKNVSILSDRFKKISNISKPSHFIASKGFKNLITNFILTDSQEIRPKYIFYTTHKNKEYLTAPYVEEINENYYYPNIHNEPQFDDDDLRQNFKIFEGLNIVSSDLIINEPALIKPGSVFALEENVSIIFKNKVLILGRENKRVIFKGIKESTKWGSISIEGDESFVNYSDFYGGFGDILNNKFYTSMLSVRNSKNVTLQNITLIQKNETNIPNYYDDLLHVIYSKNLKIINAKFLNSLGDALDIDVSEAEILNSFFENSGNDSIDFMSSNASVENVKITNSGDKGISIGENSKINITDSTINRSFIGIESKDSSVVEVHKSSFFNNNINLHGYSKNWRYGTKGGKFVINNSNFQSHNSKLILLSKILNAEGKKVHDNLDDFTTTKNLFISKNNSKIIINNSLISDDYLYIGNKKNLDIKN